MSKKVLGAMLCIAMTASLMTGCSNSKIKETGSNGGQAEGDRKITVMVESGSPAETVAKSTAAEFKELTGYEVVVDTVPYSGMYDKLSTEVKANAAAHDVACLDVLWLPAFEHALEPLNDLATDEVVGDFLPTLKDGGTLNDNLLGFPMWINCKVLIYRTDLFEDAANKEQFSAKYGRPLEVPTTWEEYMECAEFFTTEDMYGTAVFGLAGGDAVCSFLDHVSQAGAMPLVMDDDKQVLVDQKPYVDALQFLCNLYDAGYVPEETLSVASTEAQEMFNNGKLAMQLNWSHQYPAAYQLNQGNVGVAPMIGGEKGVAATTGPWYQCVMKNSKNVDIAKQYVKFMYDHNENYMTEGSLKIAGRTSVYETYSKEAGNEHLGAVLDTLSNEYSQNRPATPNWIEIEEVLQNTVQAALSGKDTPEGALADAKSKIENIVNGR